MSKLFQYLYDRRVAVKRGFFAVLALIMFADMIVERHEAHFFGDRYYDFWAVFGLLVTLALILFWKWLSRVLLEREEDYYDK
jgi:predicted tellurium resistance membrane protein TerC